MVELTWIFLSKPRSPTVRWEWPMCLYKGPMQRHAAYISCEDPYDDLFAKMGNHKPLRVVCLKYNRVLMNGAQDRNYRRMLSDLQFLNLRAAIEFTEAFVERHPDWHPRIF